MQRPALIAIAILGLTACGQGERGTADVAAPGGMNASPYAATCIELAASENWAEAARLCTLALGADPNDETVKAALASANAALGAESVGSGAAALPSGEAAQEAVDEAAEQAKEALPN